MRGSLFELLNKLHYLILYHLLMMLVVNVIKASVYGQNFHSFLSAYPVFMSLMNGLNVFQTDLFLSFSVSDLYSLQTDLRRTFKVDDSLHWTVLN